MIKASRKSRGHYRRVVAVDALRQSVFLISSRCRETPMRAGRIIIMIIQIIQ